MGWNKKREKKRKEKKIIYTDRDFVRPVCILYYVPRLCFKKKNRTSALRPIFFGRRKRIFAKLRMAFRSRVRRVQL